MGLTEICNNDISLFVNKILIFIPERKKVGRTGRLGRDLYVKRIHGGATLSILGERTLSEVQIEDVSEVQGRGRRRRKFV